MIHSAQRMFGNGRPRQSVDCQVFPFPLRSQSGMRPVREIDPEFFASDEAFTDR
jgi:hypothetical protein